MGHIKFVTPRLNTLQCVLRCLLGRMPTHPEMCIYHSRLFKDCR